MGAFSDYLETELLDHTLGKTASSWTAPNQVYVGLCTTVPTDAASGEWAGASTYKRMAVNFNAASGSSIISSTTVVTFPQATGTSWGTITGYALFDSSSGGNMLYYANLASAVTVNANDTVEFAGGAIVVTLD
jgi:hypothetical protein